MVKCLSVYLHQGSLLACPSVVCAASGSLKSLGHSGDAASCPECVKNGGHIGNTCCSRDTWADSDTERLIKESFSALMAQEDERAAALWFFDWSNANCGAEILEFKVFQIRTSFAFHKDVS